jgi:cell division protein FtsB
MSHISQFTDFYKRRLSRLNKYWLVTILFFVFTFLTGDSSLYNRYRYVEKINALENEIRRYRMEIEHNRQRIQELQTSKAGLEQFAREAYFMKSEDEDLFVVEE